MTAPADRAPSLSLVPSFESPSQNSSGPVVPATAEVRAGFGIDESAPLRVKIVTLAGVIIPFLALAFAVFSLWGWGFSWTHLGLLLGMYVTTALGVTVGYHRLFTHRAFETSATMRFIFAMLGAMAVEGPVLKWVAIHRRHHQHSDDEGDPHSPHHHGGGIWGVIRGGWHAHVGWIFAPDPGDLGHYVTDLANDRPVVLVSRTWMFWSAFGIILPAILGGLITWSWTGAWLGLIWGGLARVFLVHHVTWSVNSVCHLWGTRAFKSDDHSRNNAFFGVIGFGEGWHNNHHAFPTSARHGLRWWEIDISYWVIRALAWAKLARKVRLPTATALEAKRLVRAG